MSGHISTKGSAVIPGFGRGPVGEGEFETAMKSAHAFLLREEEKKSG